MVSNVRIKKAANLVNEFVKSAQSFGPKSSVEKEVELKTQIESALAVTIPNIFRKYWKELTVTSAKLTDKKALRGDLDILNYYQAITHDGLPLFRKVKFVKDLPQKVMNFVQLAREQDVDFNTGLARLSSDLDDVCSQIVSSYNQYTKLVDSNKQYKNDPFVDDAFAEQAKRTDDKAKGVVQQKLSVNDATRTVRGLTRQMANAEGSQDVSKAYQQFQASVAPLMKAYSGDSEFNKAVQQFVDEYFEHTGKRLETQLKNL